MAVDYNELLYEKMSAEYDSFIERLKQMPPEQIIEHSYEKVMKEDLLSCFEFTDRSQSEAKAMYLQKNPLDALYEAWLKTDASYMDMLRDSADECVKSAVKMMKDRQRESR